MSSRINEFGRTAILALKVRLTAALRWRWSATDLARSRGNSIGERVVLPNGSDLGWHSRIGDSSSFSGPLTVRGTGEFLVGKWVAVGVELRVVTSNHDVNRANMHVPLNREIGVSDGQIPGSVRVGNAVWIGDRVTLLAGARLGDGCVIAAGAVVASEIPAFHVAGGVPARVIRARFDDSAISALEQIAWWDWDLDRIKRNRALFEVDLRGLSGDELLRLVRL